MQRYKVRVTTIKRTVEVGETTVNIETDDMVKAQHYLEITSTFGKYSDKNPLRYLTQQQIEDSDVTTIVVLGEASEEAIDPPAPFPETVS